MKTLFLLALPFNFLFGTLSAQSIYPFTIYGGYSPQQHPKVDYLIVNRDIPADEFQFTLTNNAPQYHIGLVKNFAFRKPFYGTVGVEYAQQKQTYSIAMTYRPEPGNYDLTYTSQSIQIPAAIHARMGVLDFSSGVLARFNFKSKVEGEHTMGITAKESSNEFGFHGGIGIHLGHARLGVNYQSTFTRDGSCMIHREKSLELRSVPGNVTFSLGYSF